MTVGAITAGAALLAACGVNDVNCTEEAVASITVTPVDSITGDPVPDATVWVADGAFRDTLEVVDGTAAGPWERPGTYDVHVEHELYFDWVREDVAVLEGRCHVFPSTLTARLDPLSKIDPLDRW